MRLPEKLCQHCKVCNCCDSCLHVHCHCAASLWNLVACWVVSLYTNGSRSLLQYLHADGELSGPCHIDWQLSDACCQHMALVTSVMQSHDNTQNLVSSHVVTRSTALMVQ